jgi:outer membrane protein assembly factor BamB
MRLRALTLIALAALPVGGCRPARAPPAPPARVNLPAGAWPVFRGDAALTGVRPGPFPARLQRRWRQPLGARTRSCAVVSADARLFVGTESGDLLALDRAGKVLWRYAAGAAIETPPLLTAGLVVAGTATGTLHAVDAATGAGLWRFAAEDKIVGSANAVAPTATHPALVVFGSYDTQIYALAAESGARHWAHSTRNYVNGAPAVTTDGRVVFGGCDGQLHVIRAADGSAEAEIDAGSYVAAAPAVAGGIAYVGTYGNEFLALDLAAGTVAWRFAPPEGAQPFFASPAVAEDRLVTGSRDGFVYCLSRADGALLWRHRTGGEVDASPVVVGDTVLAGSADGRLYLLALADGRLRGQFELGAPVSGSPAVGAGLVVVTTEDGAVHAFEGAP